MGGAYGNDPLTATYFNDVQFRNIDGSYNYNVSGAGFQFAYTPGTTGQGAISGFSNVSVNVPLPPDTRLSNPPVNAGLPKNVIVTFNTQQYPDAQSVVINFRVPALYVTDTSNGNINGGEIDVSVSCSLNGAPFTLLSTQTQGTAVPGVLQFVGKCTTPYFRTYQYTLPITSPPQSFYQWTLLFQKVTQDVESVSVEADIYVDSVAVISTSQYNYPNTALVGLYVDALQFGIVPSRAYLIQGLLVSVPSGYTPTQYTPGISFTRQCDVTSGQENIGMTVQDPAQLNGIVAGMTAYGFGLDPVTGAPIHSVINDGPGAIFFHVDFYPTGTADDQTFTFVNPNYPGQYASAATYPDVWNGTFVTGVWTDNPAWIFYDFVTNPRYGLGQYVNTNNVDIWTLYQLSQYCDQMVDNGQGLGILEPQFTINAFIKNAQDAYNTLLDLASAFRGMLYYANGTIRANTTDDKTPVFNYTNANVINGAFNYSSSARAARHTAVRVKYTDPNNLYRDNYVLLEDPIGIPLYGYNLKEISAFGCTSQGQATRLAQWILTTERLRTETVSFQVGLDGLYVRPGDVFNLYDNYRMNRSQGGRVVSFDTGQQFITLDRPVNLDSGCIYSLTCLIPTFNYDATGDLTGSNQIPEIRNPQIQSCMVMDADVSGLSTVQVSGGFSGLSANAVWILSATGVYTSGYVPTVFQQAPQYECLAIQLDSPGVFNVVGLNYNTGINYTVNTGFTTVMNPANSGDPTPPLPVTNFTGQIITGVLSNQSFYSYCNLTWSASLSANVGYYTLSGDAGTPGVYTGIGVTTWTGFNWFSPVTGTVDFKVCAVGKGGGVSAPQSCSLTFIPVPGLDTNQIRFWLLPDGFGDLEQIAVFYNRPSPAVTNTRIFFATGDTASFNEVLDQSFYPVQGVSLSGLSPSGTTAYFQASSFDTAATMASQGAIQQANNTLLYLVDNELMSVGPVTGLTGNQYAFSMSRGVLGTYATSHSANTTGWVFYSADINSFTDGSLTQVFNATGYVTGVATRYFRIENNTATLQGAITPSDYSLYYTLPNPTPNAPTSLAASAPGGTIVHLTWTASTSDDVLQYQVYRATSPFSTFSLVGYESSKTFFDDTTVTVGTEYEYYLLTEAQSEEVSPPSNTVTVTPPPIPTGANLAPPSNPTAPSLTSSGYYTTYDGAILNTMAFSLAAIPAGAIGQYLLYGTGAALIVANDIQNSGVTAVASIDDLSPGIGYYVATQAYSAYGVLSQQVTGNSNQPFVAPGKAPFAVVTPPTGVNFGPAVAGSQVAAVYNTNTTPPSLWGALTGNWTPSPDSDVAFYEYYASEGNTPPSPTAAVNSSQTVPAAQNVVTYYGFAGVETLYLWIRAINRSQDTSAWARSSQGSPASTAYGGNLGAQDADGAQVTSFTIAPTSATVTTPISVEYFNTLIWTPPGGTASGAFAVNLNGCGFSAKPTYGTALLSSSQAPGGPNIYAQYNYDDASGSNTVAVFDILPYTGTTVPNWSYRFSVHLME